MADIEAALGELYSADHRVTDKPCYRYMSIQQGSYPECKTPLSFIVKVDETHSEILTFDSSESGALPLTLQLIFILPSSMHVYIVVLVCRVCVEHECDARKASPCVFIVSNHAYSSCPYSSCLLFARTSVVECALDGAYVASSDAFKAANDGVDAIETYMNQGEALHVFKSKAGFNAHKGKKVY